MNLLTRGRAVRPGRSPRRPAYARCLSPIGPARRHSARPASPLVPPPIPITQEERRIVTVLFVDMVGFTALACRLDPEDVRVVQTEYFSAVTEIIRRWDGVVEKYVGDAVMAVFGAPRSDGYDAYRAVCAGLQLQEVLSGRRLRNGQPVQVRVGIATGEALVDLAATTEGGQRFLSGDVVNTAARVEAHAVAGTVAVTAATRRATGDLVRYQRLDMITVAGKAEPLDIWRPLGVAPARVSIDRRDEVPQVGRQVELATVTERVERAVRDGVPQLVAVTGQAGSGKSRLVRELSRHPRIGAAGPVRWLVGRCSPHGGWPEALGLSGRGSDLIDDQETRSGWQRRLLATAASEPTVLVVEDLDWADAVVVRFLRDLVTAAASAAQPVRLAVIVTHRPRSIDSDVLQPNCRVSLGPLDREQTDRLVRALLRRAGQPTTLRNRLVPLAAGNPMYAETYVQMIAERGLPAGPDPELPAPERVRAAVSARLDQLSTTDRGALQAASVLGREVSAQALAFLLSTDSDNACAILRRLERADLLVRTSESGASRYTFSAPAVGAVAYALLPRTARADHHRRAAEWLDTLSGSGQPHVAVERARHWKAVLGLSRVLGRDVAPYLPAAQRAFADAARCRGMRRAANRVASDRAPHGSPRHLPPCEWSVPRGGQRPGPTAVHGPASRGPPLPMVPATRDRLALMSEERP